MSYADLGGGREDIPAAYATAIAHPCPTCGAGIRELCVNPETGKERHIPCVNRATR